MTKFLYVFLLNLLLFNEKPYVDARLSHPKALDKVCFVIEESGWNDLPKPLGRSPSPAKAPNDINDAKVYSGCLDGTENPFSDDQSLNHRLYKNIGLDINLKRKKVEHETKPVEQLRNVLEYSQYSKKNRNESERMRKKRFFPAYLSAISPEKPERFLDYTYSQMPFNEGQRSQEKKSRRSTRSSEAWHNEKRSLNFDQYLMPKAVPHRLGRLRRRRFEDKAFEILRDDPISEYSRVRRFLDQERAKKQTKVSSTLEAKEAAMSRVLDPNLNSDGILEPHVRKRRGHTRKRDLSFKYMKKLRLKRHKT